MTLLTKSTELENAIKKLEPNKIAVAYVGKHWSNYIIPKELQEIILSPTIGSNPYAIEELINTLGIDNVYFLDNLHSKFFLSENAAIIGSCNLSKNALSETGLLEIGYKINNPTEINRLYSLFEDYKKKAIKKYTNQKKREKLISLKKDWSKNKRFVYPKEDIEKISIQLNTRF